MNRTPEELLKFREAKDLDGKMLGSLEMIHYDIQRMIDAWHCRRGEHKWSLWSSVSCGNVAEANSLGGKDFSYIDCVHCGQEMPESRIYHKTGIREKNSKTFEEYKKEIESD